MNVVINTFIAFSGPAIDLEPLIEDIQAAVIKHGYAVDPGTDVLSSLIVARESGVGEFENPDDFIVIAIKDAIGVSIPMKEEEDESSSSTGD